MNDIVKINLITKQRVVEVRKEREEVLLKYGKTVFPSGLGEMEDQIWTYYLLGVKKMWDNYLGGVKPAYKLKEMFEEEDELAIKIRDYKEKIK